MKKKSTKKKAPPQKPYVLDREKVTGETVIIDDPKNKDLIVLTTFESKSGGTVADAAITTHGSTISELKKNRRIHDNKEKALKRYPRIAAALKAPRITPRRRSIR